MYVEDGTSTGIFGGPSISIPISLGAKIGYEEAAIIQQFHTWMNDLYDFVELDGKRWISKTYKDISSYFQLPLKHIINIINKLNELKIFTLIKTKVGNLITLNYSLLSSLIKVKKQTKNNRTGYKNNIKNFINRKDIQSNSVPNLGTDFGKWSDEYFKDIQSNSVPNLGTDFKYRSRTTPYNNVNNNYLYNKTNTICNLSYRNPGEGSRADFFSKTFLRFKNLFDEIDINESNISYWVKKYGNHYVCEKINLLISAKPSNPAAWLVAAINRNFLPKSAAKGPSITFTNLEEMKMQTIDAKNLELQAREDEKDKILTWWSSLENNAKVRLYEDVIAIQYTFRIFMEQAGINILDDMFPTHWLFSMFVDILKSRRQKLK